MDTSDATDSLQQAWHVSGARAALLFTCSWVWKSHMDVGQNPVPPVNLKVHGHPLYHMISRF